MAATMLRFQEYYESSEFQGRVFDLEEFADWYAVEKGDGVFSYYEDYSGYNIPLSILDMFQTGAFDPLSRKETVLLNILQGLPATGYLITTSKGESSDRASLAHEVMHGIFHTDRHYASQVKACVEKFDVTEVLAWLHEIGYHPSVHVDEINAYSLTGLSPSWPIGPNTDQLTQALADVFNQHFGFSPLGEEGEARLAALPIPVIWP